MGRFVEGEDRSQSTLLPKRLDDYVTEDRPVRVVDVFVDNLDLATLGRNSARKACPLKAPCTPAAQRRIRRWEHEAVIEALQQRLDHDPNKMRVRRQTVEHLFGTLKAWMGSTHLLMRTLKHVSTEMSLHVLAYNLKRVMRILGIAPLMQAMCA